MARKKKRFTAKTKSLTATMRKAIEAAAQTVGVAAPSFAKGDGKSYEAWVLFEAAQVLKSKPNYTVQPVNHQNVPVTTFRVRGGPGFFTPGTSSKGDEPCHFLVQNGRGWLELHGSLRHQGMSGADHELDISIVRHRHAEEQRWNGPARAFEGEARLGLELKDYDPTAYLPKAFARALIGVAFELEPLRAVQPVQLSIGNRIFFASGGPPSVKLALVSSAQLRPSSEKLLKHYNIAAYSSVRASLSGNPLPAHLSLLLSLL